MKRHTLTALSLPNTTTTTTTTHSPIAIYEGQKGTTNTTSTAPSSLNTTMNTTPRKNALPFLKDISPTLPQHLIQNGTTNTSESGGVVVTTFHSPPSMSKHLYHMMQQESPLLPPASSSTSPSGYTSTKVVRISSQQHQTSMLSQQFDMNRNRRSSSMSSTISRNSNMTTSTMTSCGSSMSDTDAIPGPQSSITKKRKTRCCRSIDRMEISKYFSIKEEEAAKEMNISKSKLKRVKKEMGISRWPYRRLEALNQELKEVRDLIHTSKDPSNDSDVAIVETTSQANNNLTQLCEQEKILQRSIDLIYQMPNIIVNQSNENIKEICFKAQRISLNNLLNL